MEKLDIENNINEGKPDINPVQRAQDVFGMFQTVTAAPTKTPRNFFEQVKIYSSGGTFRIYIYDTVSNAWKYATLT